VAEAGQAPVGADGAPVTDLAPSCWRCGRTLAEWLSRPWSLRCQRCKAPNRRGDPPREAARTA